MIDIHTHYIPGVDDGSWDSSMTHTMMVSERMQGAAGFFATPHSFAFDCGADKVSHAYSELKQYLQRYGMDNLIHLGCEVACEPREMEHVLKNLRTGIYPTMNGTRYVLTEFSPRVLPDEAILMAAALVRESWIPIIAHTERYPKLFDGKTIDQLLELGCLLQVNAYSFQEESSDTIKSNARRLLAERKVSFLGSDAHRLNHRPPSIALGIAYVKENCEKEYADAVLSGNAASLLLGDGVRGEVNN